MIVRSIFLNDEVLLHLQFLQLGNLDIGFLLVCQRRDENPIACHCFLGGNSPRLEIGQFLDQRLFQSIGILDRNVAQLETGFERLRLGHLIGHGVRKILRHFIRSRLGRTGRSRL